MFYAEAEIGSSRSLNENHQSYRINETPSFYNKSSRYNNVGVIFITIKRKKNLFYYDIHQLYQQCVTRLLWTTGLVQYFADESAFCGASIVEEVAMGIIKAQAMALIIRFAGIPERSAHGHRGAGYPVPRIFLVPVTASNPVPIVPICVNNV